MNLRHLLMLPWMALSKDSRRPLAGLSTVLAAVIVLGAAFDDTGINASTLAVVPAAHIAALMDLLFWATVMSSSLLLLHTANHLRMPVLERDVHASLALYASITIALPALALGALDGHLMLAFVEIALGASLGVALGGWAMPQTLASRTRHVASLLSAVALAAALVWLTGYGNRKPDGDISMALIYAGIASPLFAQIQTMKLQRLWASNRAELPLLALLPGLASRAEIKRSLLQACLLPSFGAQCLLLIASLGVAAWLQLGTVGWAMVTLDQLLGMGMLLAFTLATLGGLPMDGWGRKGFLLGAIIVISTGGGMAAMTDISSTAAHYVLLAMAVVWAALLAPLVNLAWRGWQRFQHRPHPFLPTAL